MLEHHEKHGADITMAVTPVRADEAPGFGILKTDDHSGSRSSTRSRRGTS